MAIKTTPEEALIGLKKLGKDLDSQQAQILKCEGYYAGAQNLRFATHKFREAFGALFREFADNWMAMVVDTTNSRLGIDGFRFPQTSTQGVTPSSPAPLDLTGDKEAWEIWQRNSLDRDSKLAHQTALISGRSYVIVGPPIETNGAPLITVEHPSQVTVRRSSANRRTRIAALKAWWDEDEKRMMATLYLPDSISKFQSKGKQREAKKVCETNWAGREGVKEVEANPLGIVPVVPLYNKETLLGNGDSEFEQVIPIQDALNKYMTDMLLASEFSAFRQRVVIGLATPKDKDGNPLPQADQALISAASRFMAFEDDTVKIQEFGTTDLQNYVNAIILCRDHIAARTNTPPHYLIGSVVNVSGDALKAAESGFVSKIRDRSDYYGEGWEEVMRLAFLIEKDKVRGAAHQAETIWSDPEVVSESSKADALAKLAALGLPRQAIWERYGLSPQEIERYLQLEEESVAAGVPSEPEPQALAALLRAAATEGQ
ncbi:MAG: phage portal protein [Solirubrobacteraceae bacterium]